MVRESTWIAPPDDREEDSGRPFVDRHIANDDTFISLVKLKPGAAARRGETRSVKGLINTVSCGGTSHFFYGIYSLGSIMFSIFCSAQTVSLTTFSYILCALMTIAPFSQRRPGPS